MGTNPHSKEACIGATGSVDQNPATKVLAGTPLPNAILNKNARLNKNASMCQGSLIVFASTLAAVPKTAPGTN